MKRRRMRYSIQRQFSLIFIGLMIGVVLLCILLGNLFLSTYYTREKEKVILRAYEELLRAAEDVSDFGAQETAAKLDDLALRYNITIIIVNANSNILYASTNGGREQEFRLLGYILGRQGDVHEVQILEQTQEYTIRRGRLAGNESLEMYGRLENGASFLMQTPIESIRESANYANRFFAYVGLVGTIAGGVIIWFVTRRITRPILQLSEISERMVELDFEARYTGQEKNEIGMLGGNINELAESLERSISELKTANNELRRDIEQKEAIDEMRQEFIANVSHELKTPIALIQGYAEGLRDGIADDAESRAFYCEVIESEAGKMNRMVKQLLTLQSLESGSETVRFERFELTELIRNYLQSARLLAEQEGIEVRFGEYPPTYVWGDEFRAEEVLTNFFSNAVHHCSANTAGERFIEIVLEARGRGTEPVVRIWVRNTGAPIPEESLGRLWEKFYKVDKARTREYGGSGVGLSIVKAIQDLIGQDCGVENTPDGVRFWYELAAR